MGRRFSGVLKPPYRARGLKNGGGHSSQVGCPFVFTGGLYNLADLHQGQGKYSEAELLYERALHILEQTQAPTPPDLAEILNNIAVLQEIQGNHEMSRSFYEQSFCEIREQALGLVRLFRTNGAAHLLA